MRRYKTAQLVREAGIESKQRRHRYKFTGKEACYTPNQVECGDVTYIGDIYTRKNAASIKVA
ncbi:hypothetical protein SK355_07785 [Candidatus Fukatsuia symbiotica]|uniref:Uncharacterized protein n=1 Tax=Candidatus Fukatsuia symbiotica TaxID=1878942 RepID=A0A2U8I6M2_9GAMM|nr:hypothetical protein [Candidatus Fukatsuia symbiotica]AWK14810.1 hypothetical protein CCS41_10545 [Candidatus Fukatsuia symbiotica]MEA9445147.1 hypothetical protein [Candidatus Fukatsuia symbiotica]